MIGENINNQNHELMKLITKFKFKNIEVIMQEQTSEIYDYLNIFDLSVIASVEKASQMQFQNAC